MDHITIRTDKPYEVLLGRGLLGDLGSLCLEVHSPSKICIISEESIYRHYGEVAERSLADAGYEVHKILLPGGEENKSTANIAQLWETLAEKEFSRSDLLLSLGGGIMGDITGFAAATYLRGIPFVQVPTTFLAAVDASVGGKTAINLSKGKNLAGAFWQPSLVVFDSRTMETLPLACLQDGMAEVVKCAAIADSSLFNDVSKMDFPLREEDLLHCVSAGVTIKGRLVESDERDLGQRQLLNFGHTLGHAIEQCSNYEISHGHGVAMGMVLCARASLSLGWSKEDCLTPLKRVLENLDFPLQCDFSPQELEEAVLRDKKRKGDSITLVIPEKIGYCILKTIPLNKLKDFIEKGLYEY